MTPAAPTPPPGEPRARLWTVAPLVVACGLLVRLRLFPEGETDLGFHLALGRLLLAGHFPRTNALSWVAGDEPWFPTAWLFDLLAALSTRLLPEAAGPKLLALLFTGAAVVLVGLVCSRRARTGAVLTLPLVLLLWQRATPRPHAASWMLLCLVLWLSVRAREEASPAGRLWALAACALGSNLHTGSAFAAAVGGLFALEEAASRRSLSALWLPVAFALTPLCNPGGLYQLTSLLYHFQVHEVVRIAEFEPPTFAATPWFFVLLPLALGAALLRARSEPALLAATLLFGLLGLRSGRMVYELLLLSLPSLAAVLGVVERRAGVRAALLACAGLVLLAGASTPVLQALREPATISWDPLRLPLRAARFLDAADLRERGFNGLRDGGYLAWARPGVPIFLDGRIQAAPPGLWHELELAERSPAAFDRFLRGHGVRWALTSRRRERLNGHRLLEGDPGWALVYFDEISEVFVRRDLPELAPLVAARAYQVLHPWGDPLATLRQLDREGLTLLQRELQRLRETAPEEPVAALLACGAAARLGAGAEAACAGARALLRGSPLAPLLGQVEQLPGIGPPDTPGGYPPPQGLPGQPPQ